MLALLTKAKRWAWLFGAAALYVLYLITRLRIVEFQKEKALYRAEHAEAQLDFTRDVAEADEEIEADTDVRTKKIADEIEEGKPVESLSDPNRDW